MTVPRFTSRVFDAGLALYDRLYEAPWPKHPVTGAAPPVEFSDENPLAAGESVSVALNLEALGQSTIEWRRLSPPGRDENLMLYTVIRSYVPNVDTSKAVWLRLRELADVAQGVVFDTTSNQVLELGFAGELKAGLVTSVTPSVGPINGGGWGGLCVVAYRFMANI